MKGLFEITLLQIAVFVVLATIGCIGWSGVIDWFKGIANNVKSKPRDIPGIASGLAVFFAGIAGGILLSFASKEFHSIYFAAYASIFCIALMQASYRKLFSSPKALEDLPEAVLEAVKSKISKV